MGETQTTGTAASRAFTSIAPDCPACGREFSSPDCPTGHDMSPPAADQSVGHLVRYRRGLRRPLGAVTEVAAGLVHIVEPGSARVRTVSEAKVEVLDAYAGLDRISSPRYRLVALSREEGWADSVGVWLSANPAAHLRTIGDRRSFALSAIGCGDVEGLEQSGLGATEIRWLTMHSHRFNGAWATAFRAALDLEPTRYRDHLLVLIEAVSHHPSLITTPELRAHLLEVDGDTFGTALLRMLVGSGRRSDAAAATEELVALGGPNIAAKTEGLYGGSQTVPDSAWSRAATGCAVSTSDLKVIYAEWPDIADDLIDRDLVLRLSDDPSDLPLALRSRLAVDTLADHELEAVGAFDELARRAFVAGDSHVLRSIDSPAAADYLALDGLRRGEIPEHLPNNRVAHAVAASIRAGVAHPNALDDASAWQIIDDLITDDAALQYPTQAAVWQLRRAVRDLFAWDLDSAQERAKRALEHASYEAVRDEALNIIAFVLHAYGRSEQAIAALEKALEGDYSANLQANIGIIAEELRPEIAAKHVTRLAQEAPTLELKLAAVRRAFGIWANTAAAWDDDGISMPQDLVVTFRELIVDEIPYDDYVSLIQLLSQADRDWLATASNTDKGPHRSTPARKIYVARSDRDPSSFVEALAEVSRSGIDDEWFVAERDTFVSGLRTIIFEDLDAIGPAAYAFAAIDAGLELDDYDYVTLSCGAAMSILGAIHQDDRLPSDAVVSMIRTARERLKSLDAEQREHVEPLVQMTGNRYGAVIGSFHAQVHDDIVEAIQTIAMQLYGMPRGRIRWDVVEQAVRPMREQALRSKSELRAAMALVSDDDLRSNLGDIESAFTNLAAKLSNPRRVF